MRLLFPLFIAVPIIEMLILIEVGSLIGTLPTIGLVLLTAVIGLHLLRQQGLSTLLRANQKLAEGGIPAEEVLEGLLLAIGGALLLTPGFFTDSIGFACLLPFTRRAIVKRMIAKGVMKAVNVGSMAGSQSFSQSDFSQSEFKQQGSGFEYSEHHDQSKQDGDIIDGEYSAVDDDHLLKK